jgi:hypothetical protein
MEQIKLPEGITTEMVSDAKSKFGDKNVKLAMVQCNEEGTEFKELLIRRPDTSITNQIKKFIDSNPGKAEEIALNHCLLSHKEEVKANEWMRSGAVDGIFQLLPVTKAIIKNC